MKSNPWRDAAEWYRDTVYSDEAIRPRTGIREEPLPDRIRAIRAIETGLPSYRQSRESIFYQQARLMETYEDDYSFQRETVRYYPTYQSLSDTELRGYFSWRTRLRAGNTERSSLSFAFLYIYELLHLIGCADAADGFEKLRRFGTEYGALDDRILRYLKPWLWDFVVYYGLDASLLAGSRTVQRDDALTVLRDMEGKDSAEITAAAIELSGYRLERSRFYKTHTRETEDVVARVLAGVAAHYARGCKKTWTEEYFGSVYRRPVTLFQTAVFYDRRREERDYTVDALRSYALRNGVWYATGCDYDRLRKHRLSDLLRTVDSVLREAYAFPHPLKPGLSTKWLVALIREQAEIRFAETKQAERKVLRLDFSSLDRIRRDAAATREKLIVEEETELLFPEPSEPGPPPVSAKEENREAPAAPPGGPAALPETWELPLSPEETRYLRCLLRGEDLAWLRERGLLPSLLTDGINEKLFDRFEDTVLEDSGPVEDYIEALKEMVDG